MHPTRPCIHCGHEVVVASGARRCPACGRGLGAADVSLSHSIVSGHGGKIEVESAVGAGTTFRVDLPARRASPAAT